MEGADESKNVVQLIFSAGGKNGHFGLRTRSVDEVIQLQNDEYTDKCGKL